ncbi:PQQ-dependent sugar dehydrogenase [Clostridium sp. D2Q-11]|uniref:PQQ-dependent sugar dehydrogenase n=1 Tax=Anaeromonas frigoriresistens TaxID=2683708 RepID=A0A942Z9K5_9FIRM|nr:PQQ-dependent sugar dehydrogenase [Anaeromonas frigoriresistens]MBS4538955.1 PQQ-dependent sugar dehydrogenase [Anaeromonas frigoriresistens]
MKKTCILLLIFPIILFTSCQIEEVETPQSTPAEESKNEDEDTNEATGELSESSTEDLKYKTEIIAENLEIPWEIVPISDGRIFITERPGRVLLLDEGEIYDIHNVEHIGEGGLLGMDLSPDFKNNNIIYLYYTYAEGNQIYNRVSRFTFEENTLNNEQIILDKIPGSQFHNGGRIKFGPDNKLYITTGDAQQENSSQDIDTLSGKILRINPDGTIPTDNPFDSSPVFAYGLRNPQGLAWHPVSGQLFASDHGPNRKDEINLIQPGKNYGWPIITCDEESLEYENPIACYSDFTLAPSGITFLPWSNIEETPLYIAGLRGSMVMRVDLDNEGNFIRQERLLQDLGRIRTVIYHEYAFYIATNKTDGRGTPMEGDDKIIKVTPILNASDE